MQNDAQLARLGLFDAKVPRYTSYPTAPHFSPAVGADEFTAWTAAVPRGARISLYVHVPFCRRLCWFCACRTQGTSSEDPVIAYARTLRAEIALLARTLPEGVTLSRLHWGGGTPTLLPPDEIRRTAEAIFAVLPLAEGGEFSVEIDPNEADEARLDALASVGMTRASIGVQDFDPVIQKAIGRTQSYALTRRISESLRQRGVASLNCDILYGLPHQTPVRIADSVQKLLSLGPDRVALYGYAHVPWMSRRQQLIPSQGLPTPEERLALFEAARALFAADGYGQIGIDHFALPSDGLARAAEAGVLRRNFQGYTDDQAEILIGIGASSISRFPQGYTQNAPATAAYTKAIRAGGFSATKGHVFAGEDQLRGRLIERLMCDFRINIAQLCAETGADPARVSQILQDVAQDFEDVISLEDGVFALPPRARALTRIVARAFDAYDNSKAQHSTAV